MTAYDIKPAGVQQVLTSVQNQAGEFDTILQPLNGHLEAIATATGGSGAILPALQAFFEAKGRDLTSMSNRIVAGVNGAINATTAYNNGDLEMIGDYQRSAVDLADGVIQRRTHGGLVAY